MGDVFKPGMLENFYLVAGMQAVAMKPWFLVDVDVQAERWVAVHLRWDVDRMLMAINGMLMDIIGILMDVNGMLTDVNGIRLDG
jgi:hypothetical protein